MQLYGLKACDTCRKARKALPGADFIDVRDDQMSRDVLVKALDRFGDAMVNTRSTTWRGLDDAAKALAPVDQLTAHPALMKRPLIVDGDQMYLGWTRETQKALGV